MVADLWWQKKMKRVTQFRVHSQLLSKEGRPPPGCKRRKLSWALQARNVLFDFRQYETGNKPMEYIEASLEIQKQTTKSQWVAAQEAATDTQWGCDREGPSFPCVLTRRSRDPRGLFYMDTNQAIMSSARPHTPIIS